MSGRWGRRPEKGVIVEPVDLGGLGGLGGLYRVRYTEMEMGMRKRDVDVVPGLAAATVAHQSPGGPGQLPREHGLVSDVNTRSGDAEATTATATRR
ncbi:hypothetical protein E5D57_012551 [Metarhizium anisopliae]|nr:hypothetical protein E5D57_012551 [Metarhizium anisopliae]